jgi:hypothetical protein
MNNLEDSKLAVDSGKQMQSTEDEMKSEKSALEGIGSLFHNTRDLNDLASDPDTEQLVENLKKQLKQIIEVRTGRIK